MNKTKKLLSVLLAVIMALSCMSVMASAAKTSYQTVVDLEALGAYSPYGQVTRLSTEERTSIVMDALDNILAKANINMGTLIDALGLKVMIDLTSIDQLCASFDTVKSTFNNTLFSIAKGIVNLGVLEDVKVDTWATGMSRAGTANYTILSEILEVLSAQSGLIYDVVSSGNLDLGLIGGALGDISAVTDLIGDLPGLVKGLTFPLMERWDDTIAEIQDLEAKAKGNGNVEGTLTAFAKTLFTNDMSISTVKVDANGNVTSKHNLPTTGTRVIYEKNGNVLTAKSYATQKYVDAQAKLGKTVAYGSYYITAKYVLEPEVGTEDYVWHQVNLDEDGNMKTLDDGTYDYVGGLEPNLKYYELGSQFLPGFNINDVDFTQVSLADLLYKFIPPVFNAMAPVVLNGSMKKILGGLFGAKYNFVGKVGDPAVAALPDGSNTFFTEEQGEYLWEWSNYAIINGNHYYRFQDDIYAADLSNVNNYFDIINWNYEITGDFMNEFVPTNPSPDSTLLMNLNNFIIKVANAVLLPSANTDDTASDYTAAWARPALTTGDNSNLVANLKALAQAFIKLAPQHIFGSDYATNPRCYYSMLISTDNDTVLTGLAAQLVDAIMPSMTLPTADQLVAADAKVGAVLAAVIREFAAQLIPEYNFDALIYADFGTTTADPVKTFIDPAALGLVTAGSTVSGYWLDVILTMGVNIGYEYLRAFADIGEDSAEVLEGVVNQGYMHAGGTYAAGTTQAALNAQWEAMLDYLIDWALDKDYEWTWKMENLVNTTGLTIDLATPQDPWVKLQTILGSILPVDQVLNVTATDCETKMEQFLRYDLILAIVDLRWEDLADTLKVPAGFVRNANVLDSLATVVKGIVNSLFAKVGNANGNYKLIPDTITDFDSLANQGNIAALARDLVAALHGAMVTRGLADTALPILNFFLGWKTDPQTIADPQLWTTFRDGNDYAFQWKENGVYPTIESANTYFSILNNSAGMLEKHRDSSVTDHAYDIQILSVTNDATVNTITTNYGDGLISPYETLKITIGGTYKGEEAVTFTFTYNYLGKDGQPVGGTQKMSHTVFFSDQYEDANVSGRWDGDADTDYTGTDDFGRYQFTEDLYETVVNYQARIFYVGSTISNPDRSKGTIAAPDWTQSDSCDESTRVYYNMTAPASNYFEFRAADADAGWAGTLSKDGTTETFGYLYKAKAGVTAETEFAYGAYHMGRIAVAYGGDNKTYEIDFIYYNDFDIYDIFTANQFNGYTADMVSDAAIYNEYNAAWKDIVKYATYPMMTSANGNTATDYVATIQPKIPAAIERFEAAKEAFEEAKAEAGANAGATAALPEYVQNLLAYLETDDKVLNGFEVNFQDYQYYEYFNYADIRTAARNLYASYLAPEVMDTYYIMGSGIREAELNKVIAAETNEAIAAAIEATKLENDAQAIADSITAHDNWEQPAHTKLYVDDFTARLKYYKQFLAGHEEATDHLYFLNLEIAHVEAQGFVAEDYEANSWARYAKALATAKAVAAGNDEYASYNSRIFDVKWELMNARKQLLLKEESLIEAGGTADLIANIEIAESIFAMSMDEIVLSDVALDKEMTKEDALGALIQALGYYYEGEDGETWNLYADSAYEYRDNDRPNKQANQAKVNAANNNLVAAIEYFEIAEDEPNTGIIKDDANVEAEFDTQYANEDEGFFGFIYGIDTLGNVTEDGSLADNLTTQYGDEYLEIDGDETTGTIINVKDKEGNVVESYIFIYFGDVDMDATISANDAFLAEYFEVYGEGINELYQLIASDVDMDGGVSANDGFLMEYFEVYGEGFAEQQVIAEAVSGNVYEL